MQVSIKHGSKRESGGGRNRNNSNSSGKKENEKRITTQEIHPDAIIQSVKDNGAGAVVLFLGTVRDFGETGKVSGLYYESYTAMAEKRLKEIEGKVLKTFPDVKRIKIIHRTGELSLGDISVAVGVSSPHRLEAFKACQHAIDEIKNAVPIWKQERLAGGEERWVKGHRITA